MTSPGSPWEVREWCSMDMRADEPVKPSGVVTFLFTDIEGSTRRWEAHAQSMRAALAALFAYGWARSDVEPAAAYEALRRALMMARDSGNRQIASHIAVNLTRLATNRDDTDAALDYVTLAVRSYYDCGNFSLLPTALAVLTALLDRLARAEPAATMSRFATTTFTQLAYPELAAAIRHLREVLGDDGYESLAQVGAVMTPAAMATYAIDQIDEARAELE